MIGDFDLLAFFHKPHYVVVEVAALVPTRTEAGRAPPPPEIDETRQRQYVYMIRDLGARRQPAAFVSPSGRASSSSPAAGCCIDASACSTEPQRRARTQVVRTPVDRGGRSESVPADRRARRCSAWSSACSASACPGCSPRAARRRPRRRRTSAASCRAGSHPSGSRSASTSSRCCSSCSTSRSSSSTRTPCRGPALGVYGFVAIVDLLGAVLPHVRVRGRTRRARLGPTAAGAADSCPTRPSAPSAPRRRRSGASAPMVAARRKKPPEVDAEEETGHGPCERCARRRSERAVAQHHHRPARGPRPVGPRPELVGRQLRPRLLRDRDDGRRRRALRPRPVRDGGVPRLAPAGRHHDRRRPSEPEDGAGSPPDLRPDDGAQVGDLDGRVRVDRRDVQQLRDRPGRRPDRAGRRVRPGLPSDPGDAAPRDRDAAPADRGRRAAPPPTRDRGGRRHPRDRDPVVGAAGTVLLGSGDDRRQSSRPSLDRYPRTEHNGQTVLFTRRDEYIDVVKGLADDGYTMCVDVTAVDYLAHADRALPEGVDARALRGRRRVRRPRHRSARAPAGAGSRGRPDGARPCSTSTRAPRRSSARCSTCSGSRSPTIPT